MRGLERQIIEWGARLFERKLIAGWGGNISCRVGPERFLITGQHAPLGFLTVDDIVEIDGQAKPAKGDRKPSSETMLHLAVYNGTDGNAVVHAHPPGVLVFSLSNRKFVPVSFEEKYTLGTVPVVPQETPTVTEPGRVVAELKICPIVMLQGHGTVAVGKDLKEAFLLTDLLEEAVRCHFLRAQVSGSDDEKIPSNGGTERPPAEPLPLFSPEHVKALVASVNADEAFQTLAREGGLSTTLTLDLEDREIRWTVSFVEGRITACDPGGDGEFAISGPSQWWRAVFESRIDPFLATQQGKLRLVRGELWKLSQWFKPFQRAFQLWQTIPVK
jgi:L-fuculose-phosphate aldolase